MGILRTLMWTGLCVAAGIFLSSYPIDGHTPIEHLQKAWKKNVDASELDKLQSAAKEKIVDAKKAASDKIAVASAPKEHISSDDRNALNALIAKKKTE